jgi:ribosomal protein S18 acetylase RimI-like enzyme
VIPDGVEIRTALPEEEDHALALVYTPPGPEATGLVGREDWAIAFGQGLQRLGEYRSPGDELVVATCEGAPVGVLIARPGRAKGVHWTRIPLLLATGIRIIPLRELPGFLRRGLLRMRIDLPVPEDSLYISEVHVTPPFQGRGIGAALLAHAEGLARKAQLPQLSLTTLATNPARRLYERMGYRVTAESNVPGYEELTGATGRVLMEKPLD